MHEGRTVNLYLHVDICEHNTHMILPTSVGLTQAHPNNHSYHMYNAIMETVKQRLKLAQLR